MLDLPFQIRVNGILFRSRHPLSEQQSRGSGEGRQGLQVIASGSTEKGTDRPNCLHNGLPATQPLSE